MLWTLSKCHSLWYRPRRHSKEFLSSTSWRQVLAFFRYRSGLLVGHHSVFESAQFWWFHEYRASFDDAGFYRNLPSFRLVFPLQFSAPDHLLLAAPLTSVSCLEYLLSRDFPLLAPARTFPKIDISWGKHASHK